MVIHVTNGTIRFIQPGLELITLDPKRSATIIGPGAFADDETLRAVGQRLAADVGAWNQLACCAARVVFAVSGTNPEGLKRLEALAAYAYDAMLRLPAHISTAARRYDLELAQNIKSIRSTPDFYRIVGGRDGEGAFIVSQTPDPVDFYTMLSGRTANLIPIDDVSDAFAFMNSYTQTVGIYPDSLKAELRDILPFYGAQRQVNLGYANYGSSAGAAAGCH